MTTTVTITPDIEIEVKCDCGSILTAEWYTPFHGEPFLQVEPCQDCKTANYDEGYEAGTREGGSP